MAVRTGWARMISVVLMGFLPIGVEWCLSGDGPPGEMTARIAAFDLSRMSPDTGICLLMGEKSDGTKYLLQCRHLHRTELGLDLALAVLPERNGLLENIDSTGCELHGGLAVIILSRSIAAKRDAPRPEHCARASSDPARRSGPAPSSSRAADAGWFAAGRTGRY